MNYFEFYGGDYARDTCDLSLAEHGAFLLLLTAYYSSEAPLPDDYSKLYRIARAMDEGEQRAVQTVADRFFPVSEDGLRHNKRADAELAKAQKRIDAARQNGRKSHGRPPKQKPTENPAGFDRVPGQEPNGSTHQTPCFFNSEPLSQDLENSRERDPRERAFEEAEQPTATAAEALAQALGELGLPISPLDASVINAAAAGVTPTEQVALAKVHPGKPARYLLKAAIDARQSARPPPPRTCPAPEAPRRRERTPGSDAAAARSMADIAANLGLPRPPHSDSTRQEHRP